MPTILPQDSNDNPIPALRLKKNGAHKITIGASSARNQTAFASETKIIGIYCDSPTYIAFGDENITATTDDHYIPAGIYYDVSIGGDNNAHYTHLAALQVTDSGILYISEKE